MADIDYAAYDRARALQEKLWLASRSQVPSQLPLQLRITPDRDTVLWLDGFRRWRGALSFTANALTRRRDRSLWFAEADPSPESDEELLESDEEESNVQCVYFRGTYTSSVDSRMGF